MGVPTSGKLPSGPNDRADGVNSQLGTPTSEGQLEINSSAGYGEIPIEELPDSPEVERGEQETIVRKFRMSWDEACTQILYYQRGTILGPDSNGEYSKVVSAKKQRHEGGVGILTIISESLSTDTPPDVYEVTPIELGINIIKFPRYFYAFQPTAALDNSWKDDTLLNQSVIRCLQNYFENTTAAYRDALTFQLIQSFGNLGSIEDGVATPAASFEVTLSDGTSVTIDPIPGTDDAKNAALEIIQKYWRNEETPYIIGYEVKWTSFTYTPQPLNPGGYIEDPLNDATPQLPEDVWGTGPSNPTDPDSATGTIFDDLPRINPQCYSSDGTSGGDLSISWLRKADQIDQTQRTWIKKIRCWIGTPIGFWDYDLYTNMDAPWSFGDNILAWEDISSPALLKADVGTANISTLVVTPTP